MAAPTYQSATDTDFATSVTSMAVNMPATVNAGDLLLAFASVRNAGTWTKPSGWDDISGLSQAGGGSVGKLNGFYKIAAGTEGGSTATWTASAGTSAAWIVVRVSDWHGTTPPEATTASGDVSNANPPKLVPSWGVDNSLWIAVASNAATGETTGFTGAPYNYTNLHSNGASGGGATVNVATATQALTWGSENPTTFTPNNNRYWAAATVAIKANTSIEQFIFDGHSGISDPDSAWSNDGNAFDEDPSSSADTTQSGSKTSKYLEGTGTSCDLDGSVNILGVWARNRGSNGTNSSNHYGTQATYYYSTEDLGTSTAYGDWIFGAAYSELVLLDVPTGGWTVSKVEDLKVRFYCENPDLTDYGFGGNPPTSNIANIFVVYTEEGEGSEPVNLQLDLTYSINTEHSVTKSLSYEVVTESAVSKSLGYKVISEQSLTKSSVYKIQADKQLTRTLTYTIPTSASVQNSLEYRIAGSDIVQKPLTYKVQSPQILDQALAYYINEIKKVDISLAYAIRSQQELTKALSYTIYNQTAVLIQKIQEYKISADYTLQKALSYRLGLGTQPLELGLVYTVSPTFEVNKTSDYHIIAKQVETKVLEYRIQLPSIQGEVALGYKIKTAQDITKTQDYKVLAQKTKTSQLGYRISNSESETKGLTYSVSTPGELTLGQTYTILNVTSPQLGLVYVVKPTGIKLPKDLTYKIRAKFKTEKDVQYTIITTPEKITSQILYYLGTPRTVYVMGSYTVQAKKQYTLGLSYYIGKKSGIWTTHPKISQSIYEKEEAVSTAYSKVEKVSQPTYTKVSRPSTNYNKVEQNTSTIWTKI